MGQYNPHAPEILGLEWVGIRDEDVTFSPAVNVVELGYRFQNSASRTLADGRFYTRDFPPGNADNQAYMMNIYPAGTEDQTGPIRRCLIPVSSVSTTGTFDVAPTVMSLNGTTKGFAQVIVNATAAQKSMALFFAVNQFAQELQGKRIVAVNLLHQLAWNPINANSLETAERFGELQLQSNLRWMTGILGSFSSVQYAPETYAQLSGSDVYATQRLLAFGEDVVQEGTFGDARISRVRLGDVNWMFNTPSAPQISTVMPWRYDELKRFEVSAGTNRYWIQYDFGASTRWLGEYWFGYAALEVLYCEEKRIIFGGVDSTFSQPGSGGTLALYDSRTQIASLRNATTLAASPTLAAGDYTVTVNAADVGDRTGAFSAPVSHPAADNVYPTLNGVRQLDSIITHEGVKINVTQTEGEVFTVEETDILMQLTLHESGSPVANTHGYGQIARAQVWSNVVARQDLLVSGAIIAPVTGSYEQLRFYARRFGDTTVPLRIQDMDDNARFAEITVEDFDELPHILDGWKEVTLRLNSAKDVHSASGNPFFEWEAPLETAGNRWEVLGVTAAAITGIPGNPFIEVPSAHLLGPTTYGGTTVFADWMPQYAPPVSGTDEDNTTDIILMLSEDPVTITGLAVTGDVQELTAYTECTRTPCCVPSELHFNRVTWSLPNGTDAASDAFARVNSPGMGTADEGGTWTHEGADADWETDGTSGRLTFSATAANRWAILATSAVDFDVAVTLTFEDELASGTMATGVVGRFTDVSNFYFATLRQDSTGALELWVQKFVGGVFSSITTLALGTVAERGSKWTLRFMGKGPVLKAKAWRYNLTPPSTWNITTSDTDLTSGGGTGLFGNDGSAVTGHAIVFNDFVMTPPQEEFGYYELQRTDDVEDEWKTIMQATDPGVSTFNDYEARIGVESTYRIRSVNALLFEGEWSAEVARTITEPGVTLPSCGSDKRGVLTFTTNEDQTGASNLAYAMVWQGSVDEDFSFVEANTVQVQPMFDRDYQVAFHGTERGGEAFSRTLLLANAAVAEPRLANAHSLRDLAWADLPYVCVRDDIGDRWLAAIIVPAVSARRNRRLYSAALTVIEVTADPSPVDP